MKIILKIAAIGCFATGLALGVSHAQVLDDSTKNVYSSRTTFWFSEADIKALSDSLHVLDTLLYGLENFDAVDVSNHTLVDLGNNGTATRSLYYLFPSTIGATLGINAYDPYFIPSSEIKYFDTKSPWIKIKTVVGGSGRSVVDVGYSRNINPRWNLGVDFKLLTSDKQIGSSSSRGDRNVNSTTWDLYTSYKSKNERYQLLFNVDRIKHQVLETGGIDVSEDASTAELFQYLDSPIKLTGVKAYDYKINFHLFQKYKITDELQVYYLLDKGRHDNSFEDPTPTNNALAYPNILITSDSTADLIQMRALLNEAGVLGKIGGLSYNFYLKQRYVTYNDRFSSPFGRQSESYGGAKINVRLFDVWDTDAKVEYLQGGLFDIEGRTTLPFLNLWLRSMRYKPGYQQLYYFGNHYSWVNDFEPQRADRLGGELNVKLGPVTLKPGLNLTRVANYVYFGADSLPHQSLSAAGQLLVNPSAAAELTIGKSFHLNPQVIYTAVTGSDSEIWRMPEWLISTRFYYEGVWFNDYLPVQLGVDLNWKSTYYGHAYNPVIQQFYIQNSFAIDSYLTADVFLNFKVGNARYFAKMTHANQPGTADGYFISPYYPGQRRVFDLGVTWYFFD
ncbi:MAG: putative porin [Imperialibacter sp.]|uniref:putative porin n=1 Tax=Imperialibacter sp. TaxID=2038411 RepID=UPI003A8B9367